MKNYHFILLLKSIKAYNRKTGQPVPFNSFPTSQLESIASTLGYNRRTFKDHLKSLIKQGWVIEDKTHYRILSINKINSSLKFNQYTHKKEQFKYYSYRRIKNVQGISLDMHRIFEILKVNKKQFQFQLRNPQTLYRINSSTNNHLVEMSYRKNGNSKVNRLADYYGMSMDTITVYGGYDSKKPVASAIKRMKKQGLKVIGSSTGKIIKGRKQYNCNLYDCGFEGNFFISKVKLNRTKKEKTKRQCNVVEQLFENMVNIPFNRECFVDAGILSKSYLKKNKNGELVKVPVKCWSKIIHGLLNDGFFRDIFIKAIGGTDKIFVSSEKAGEYTYRGMTFYRLPKYYLVNRNGNYEEYNKRFNPLNLTRAELIAYDKAARKEYDRISNEYLNELKHRNTSNIYPV